MAKRRGFSWGRALAGGAAGFGGGIQDMLGMLMRQQLTQENASAQDALIRGRQADADLAAGKISPEDHDAMSRGQAPQGPNVSQRLSGILEDVDKAPTMQTVPGESSMMNRAKAARVPLIGFGPTGRYSDTTDESDLPSRASGPIDSGPVSLLKGARADKLRSFPDEKIGEEMRGEGPNAQLFNVFGKYDVDSGTRNTTSAFPAGPTAGQKGGFEGRVAADTATARGPVETANAVNTENAMRGPRARTAGATTSASKAADLQADLARAVQTGGLLPEQATAATQMASEFDRQSTPFFIVQQSFRNLAGISRASGGKDMNGPQAVTFMYNMQKLQDPGAAVQEGDKGNITGAGGLADLIASWKTRAVDGGFIPKQVQDQFMDAAKGLYESGSQEHQVRIRDFSTRALQRKIPAEYVVREPAPGLDLIGQVKIVNGRRMKVVGVDADGSPLVEEVR